MRSIVIPVALLVCAAWGSACSVILPLGGPAGAADSASPDLLADGPGSLDNASDGACACPLGCDDAGACKTFVPSNLPAFPAPTCAGISFSADGTIDTGTCLVLFCKGTLVPQSNGPQICRFAVGQFVITQEATVTVSGPNALLVAASAVVKISGTLDASATGRIAGPGGWDGGDIVNDGFGGTGTGGAGPGGGKHCGCRAVVDGEGDDCGGGGAGFATAGGTGGSELTTPVCSLVGAGGPTYGNDGVIPLQGGSGGASGHNDSMPSSSPPGVGGGGGGALQIVALTTISLEGKIRAAGGGGGGDYGSGGGGGSGGAVLLEAPLVSGTGKVTVAGGGGGGAGTGTNSAGTLQAKGNPGQDGPDTGQAWGGIGATAADGGGGMGGGGGTKGPTSGLPGDRGGGGGGASGRIRVNNLDGKLPPGMSLNGDATSGALQPH